MGKQEYKFSDHVRFGSLPKVERKVITKMTNRSATKGIDHTAICTGEIGAMLACFETHAWRTGDCLGEISTMHACVEEHKGDPVRAVRRAAPTGAHALPLAAARRLLHTRSARSFRPHTRRAGPACHGAAVAGRAAAARLSVLCQAARAWAHPVAPLRSRSELLLAPGGTQHHAMPVPILVRICCRGFCWRLLWSVLRELVLLPAASPFLCGARRSTASCVVVSDELAACHLALSHRLHWLASRLRRSHRRR